MACKLLCHYFLMNSLLDSTDCTTDGRDTLVRQGALGRFSCNDTGILSLLTA